MAGAALIRRYLQESASVMLLTGLNLATAFIAQAVIAATYGTSPSLDAYNIAVTISAYIPLIYLSCIADPMIAVLQKSADRRALAGMVLLITSAIGIINAVFFVAPVAWSRLVAPGSAKGIEALANSYITLLAPLPLFMMLLTFFSALATAEKRFVFPKVVAIAGTAMMIAAVVLGQQAGVTALVIGLLLANLLQILVLAAGAFRRNLVTLRFRNLPWTDLNHLFRLGAPLITPFALAGLIVFVDRSFASFLGPGQIATLAYAERLHTVLLGLLLAPIATVSLPYLADAHARGEFGKTFVVQMRLVVLVFLPAAVWLTIESAPLVDLIFRRGNFSLLDTQKVGYALQGLTIGLLFYGFTNLLGRTFIARGETWKIALLGPLSPVIKWSLNRLLVPELQLLGVTLASSLHQAVMALLMIVMILRKPSRAELKKEVGYSGAALVAVIAAAAAATGWSKLVQTPAAGSFISRAAHITMSGILFTATYLAVLWVLGGRERLRILRREG